MMSREFTCWGIKFIPLERLYSILAKMVTNITATCSDPPFYLVKIIPLNMIYFALTGNCTGEYVTFTVKALVHMKMEEEWGLLNTVLSTSTNKEAP